MSTGDVTQDYLFCVHVGTVTLWVEKNIRELCTDRGADLVLIDDKPLISLIWNMLVDNFKDLLSLRGVIDLI